MHTDTAKDKKTDGRDDLMERDTSKLGRLIKDATGSRRVGTFKTTQKNLQVFVNEFF